jgi:hypothetical protein
VFRRSVAHPPQGVIPINLLEGETVRHDIALRSPHLVIISWRRGAAAEHPSPASQALCGRGVVMLRLRLFRPVVTLALVATLHSGFPMVAPMQAPVVPFTPRP